MTYKYVIQYDNICLLLSLMHTVVLQYSGVLVLYIVQVSIRV